MAAMKKKSPVSHFRPRKGSPTKCQQRTLFNGRCKNGEIYSRLILSLFSDMQRANLSFLFPSVSPREERKVGSLRELVTKRGTFSHVSAFFHSFFFFSPFLPCFVCVSFLRRTRKRRIKFTGPQKKKNSYHFLSSESFSSK